MRRANSSSTDQALFEVAHDPTRPFVVDAGVAQVWALGTRFDVRRPDEGVDVVLLEGAVEAEAGDRRQVMLGPNHRVAVTREAMQPS